MRARLGVMTLLGLVATATGTATAEAAKPKLAALILKSGSVDEELADNLTEVLIARLARRGDHEIAGKEELKSKLGVDEKAAGECIQNLGCLGRVGTELGVTAMVVGTLGRRGADYLYNLTLIDITTGRVENRIFELVAGGKVESVIAAVQATADKLFQPKIEPGGVRVTSETRGAVVYLDDAFVGSTPVRRDGIEPGPHTLRVEKEGHLGWGKEIEVPAGSTLEIKVPLAALPERRTWPAQLATGSIVVAAGAAVVGIVLVSLATDAPLDSTIPRRQAVESAQNRFLENRSGVILLAGAGGLALLSGILTLVYRHDVFPSTARGAPASKSENKAHAAYDLTPLPGGAMANATVRW